jgi:hypothetical protein
MYLIAEEEVRKDGYVKGVDGTEEDTASVVEPGGIVMVWKGEACGEATAPTAVSGE